MRLLIPVAVGGDCPIAVSGAVAVAVERDFIPFEPGCERTFAVGVGIDQRERDLGHAERLALARAGKDHVLHFCPAQGPGRLLAEHPTDGIEDVRLTAAIRPDDGGHTLAGQGELGAVAKGLEAEDLNLLELEHRWHP